MRKMDAKLSVFPVGEGNMVANRRPSIWPLNRAVENSDISIVPHRVDAKVLLYVSSADNIRNAARSSEDCGLTIPLICHRMFNTGMVQKKTDGSSILRFRSR